MEEYKEGRSLLDRCDKLLNSIAEITASNELQPSPVSVLDPSVYKDEWCSPSPITKRNIDYSFKGKTHRVSVMCVYSILFTIYFLFICPISIGKFKSIWTNHFDIKEMTWRHDWYY